MFNHYITISYNIPLKKIFGKNNKRLFKFDTLYWTIAMFGGIGIISKIADRFPSNYHKSTGYYLEENTRILLSLIEEGGEALLPLLLVIGLIQYHKLKQHL